MPELFLAILVPLIILFPLIAALAIAISYIFLGNRFEKGEKLTKTLTIGSLSGSLLLVLLLDIYALFFSSSGVVVNLGIWLSSESYQIKINFLLGYKSLIMASLISFISLIVARFSINYLHREAGYQRFFMMLCLFSAAMMLIVLSANAALAFVGWELAGVSSYLLIAYSWHRPIATSNATRAFVSNRIGDAGFIFAIVFSFYWLGTIDWKEMSTVITSRLHIGIILMGFMMAAFVKSAQFPFSGWITRALEGPTPSSAIFYGAIMVHAGVFLLIRLEPLLREVPILMAVIALLGVITLFYAYLTGFVQTDVKSALLFSTLAQVALMMIAIGLGWFNLALGHIVVHALWRTYQFLHAPSYMQQVQQAAKPVPGWLRKQTWLYTAALQRFWLDGISDWLLTKPTRSLAKEIIIFDEQVVDYLVGSSSDENKISSLSRWEAQQQGNFSVKDQVGRGRGLFGRSMEIIASALAFFEEHLILKGSGDGLLKAVDYLGKRFELIDHLLVQPRYVIVLIMTTFVVVLKGST